MEKLMRLIKLSSRSGFTLVELLIVVFILAVLAAIVLPRFNSSTDEAKEAALRSSLLEMRNAIELYYHQHNNVYPGFNKADGTGKTTIDAEGQTAFFNQLTLYTDVNGKTAIAKDLEANPQIRYGPYLKRSTLPVNPIDGSAHVTLLLNNAALDQHDQPPAPRAGDSGWWFNVVSGKFVANTPGSGIDGTPYYLW